MVMMMVEENHREMGGSKTARRWQMYSCFMKCYRVHEYILHVGGNMGMVTCMAKNNRVKQSNFG